MEQLQNHPFFAPLSVVELKILSQYGRPVILKPGDYLISEGSRGDEMYILLKGQVDVLKRDSMGVNKVIAPLQERGTIIGEISLLQPNIPRTATIQAKTDSVLLGITAEKLIQIATERLELTTKLLYKIAVLLSEKLKQTSEKLVSNESLTAPNYFQTLRTQMAQGKVAVPGRKNLENMQPHLQRKYPDQPKEENLQPEPQPQPAEHSAEMNESMPNRAAPSIFQFHNTFGPEIYNTDFSLPDNKRDPLYKLQFECPICGSKFSHYELMPKTMREDYSYFEVSQYFELGEYAQVDYNYLKVNVCPKCLYASSNKKHFKYYSGEKMQYKAPRNFPSMQTEMKKRIPIRQKIFINCLGSNIQNIERVFTRPRNYPAAITSLFLGVETLQVLSRYQSATLLIDTLELFFTMALLARQNNFLDDEKKFLLLADEKLAEVQQNSALAEMMPRFIYLSAKVKLQLNNKDEALKMLGSLIHNRTLNTKSGRRYRSLAQELWEDVKYYNKK